MNMRQGGACISDDGCERNRGKKEVANALSARRLVDESMDREERARAEMTGGRRGQGSRPDSKDMGRRQEVWIDLGRRKVEGQRGRERRRDGRLGRNCEATGEAGLEELGP